jgi:hypothetical protein
MSIFSAMLQQARPFTLGALQQLNNYSHYVQEGLLGFVSGHVV